MKRDFDLIRLLLLQLEGDTPGDLTSYPEEVQKYHQALILDARLAEGAVHYSRRSGGEIPDAVALFRLTWEGHEFLDKIRSESFWQKAKATVTDKGIDLSFDAIKGAVGLLIARLIT